jgi:hypothetical protein
MNKTGYIWMQPETHGDAWRWKEKALPKTRKGKARSPKNFKLKPLRAMSLELRKAPA